jgi:ribonuclease P protein component
VPGDPAEPPRVAFAVGRRVGGAVTRNRLRRRLRVLLRDPSLGLHPGAYLVSAAPGAADLGSHLLAPALAAAVDQATAPRHRTARPDRP